MKSAEWRADLEARWRPAAPPGPVVPADLVVSARLRVRTLGELLGGPWFGEEVGQNSTNLRDGNDQPLFFYAGKVVLMNARSSPRR